MQKTPRPALAELVLDRNRASILVFELLWGVATPFVYASTVIPGYLQHLGVSNALIGLVPALHGGLLAIVQPLSAYRIPGGAGRVGRMRAIYSIAACAYAAMGLAVLGGAGTPGAGFAVTILCVAVAAAAVGTGDPHYMEVVVSSVPAAKRGGYFGLRLVCLGVGGILGGALSEGILQGAAAPSGFGWCFLAGGVLYLLSTLTMHFYRYRPAPEEAPAADFRSFVSDRLLPHVREPRFRGYLVTVVLFALAVCVFPFLGLLIRERLHETERIFGLLGGIVMACNLVMSGVLGIVCDRWGSRRAFFLTMVLFAMGVIGCVLFHDRTALLAAYFLAAVWFPGLIVAVTDLALRLVSSAPAAEVTAIMMVAMAPARLLGPVLIGAAIDRWSYEPAVLACVGLVACAVVTLLRCERN